MDLFSFMESEYESRRSDIECPESGLGRISMPDDPWW
jgi:hypothetical protein